MSAPTTTISVDDQVRAAFTSAFDARIQCGRSPETCDYAAITVPNSEYDAELRDLMRMRIDANLRAVEGHGEIKIRIDSVAVDDETATVVTCIDDTVVIYDVQDAGDPNDDIVFDANWASVRTRWTLSLMPEGWRIGRRTNTNERFDEDQCGFAA